MGLALRTALEPLTNRECWSIIGGSGTGSVLTLGFGERVQGSLSSNPSLTIEERRYEPEFAVHVECAWRVDTEQSVLFTWTQVGDPGIWAEVRDALRGRRAERITIDEPAADLTIHLSGHMIFKAFCDQDSEGDNYSVLSPSGIVVVGPMSNIRTEKRVRQ